MRIGLVIERFVPRGGGVEAVAWQVAHGLSRAGEDVEVLARIADPRAEVPVCLVPTPAFWQPVRVLLFSRRVHRVLEARRFDVVQSFSRTRHQDLYRAGGGSHADYMERQYGRLGCALRHFSPRHAVLLRMERRIFADSRQHILCVSRRVQDEIAERHGVAAERLRVLHNGVDAERFAPRCEAALRTELSGDEQSAQRELVWLLAASGWRRKGLATALRALSLARDPRHRLWVAGGDDPEPWQREAARIGVADRVRFLGPRDDLERVLAAADALLLPTRYDGFANVCLEAAACGRAVVTSGQSGSAEAIEGGCRIVADPEDAEGFARVLDALAADPAEREALGRQGRVCAEALSWDAYVEALRALYQEIGRP